MKLKGPWADGYNHKIMSMWGSHLIQDVAFQFQSHPKWLAWAEVGLVDGLTTSKVAGCSLVCCGILSSCSGSFIFDVVCFSSSHIYCSVLGLVAFFSTSLGHEWDMVLFFFFSQDGSIHPQQREMNASSLIKSIGKSESTWEMVSRWIGNGESSSPCFVVPISCQKPEINLQELFTMSAAPVW